MKLPPIDNRPGEWPAPVIESWTRLLERARQLESKAGGSDAFERMLTTFREMVRSGRFDGLRPLLRRRLAARALTSLWVNDQTYGPRMLNVRMLDTLIEAQQPRLTRLTLIQLIQLYFRFFDRLDERDKQAETSFLERLQEHVLDQLEHIPPPRQPAIRKDVLSVLKGEGRWLLSLDGPLRLVRRVHEGGGELGQAFVEYGLDGFDGGRYGDVCRAHYYLETLRRLVPGEYDAVLDELLKPSVSKAPYEGEKRIGHAALEILIDRAGDEPGDAWQNFILNLAGDPRIASSSPNYRQWWLPLGEARINQVRGWLSKEDLRLFLQAVEQYGNESGKEDLQRMFPARKTFLEGLFRLGLIRHTRLMLGGIAQQSVRRILGAEVKTNFAKMEGTMNDKAVIYLDCGDFHLVEGSHSFKIWVYLAQPGPAMKSYDRNLFSHNDLTVQLPKEYKRLCPGLGYEAVTHNGTWQRKVFDFLAENGIGVDIEQLLSKLEYRGYLSRYGMPAVRGSKVKVPTAQQSPTPAFGTRAVLPEPLRRSRSPASEAASHSFGASVARLAGESQGPATSVVNSIRAQNKAIAKAEVVPAQMSGGVASGGAPKSESITAFGMRVLAFIYTHPGCIAGDISRSVFKEDGSMSPVLSLIPVLKKELADYVTQDEKLGWSVSFLGRQLVVEQKRTAAVIVTAPDIQNRSPQVIPDIDVAATVPAELSGSALAGSIARLPKSAIAVMRYFASNPGDKARYASNVLDIEIREINRLLHGPLSTLCKQDASFGWSVSSQAVAVLNKLFP